MKRIVPIALAIMSFTTSAAAEELPGGKLQAGLRSLPLLRSDTQITLTGDIATLALTQTFANDQPDALNARYLFPLPHDAAVHAMTLTVGDEVISAKIQRVEDAKKTFAKAKAEGKTAALLEQHRANVFSQDVANIPPGERVRVEIEYAHAVPLEDGRYRLHFPMVVASRYGNGANGVHIPELDRPLPQGGLHGDEAKRGKAPDRRQVNVRARLITGIPFAEVRSPSHRIEAVIHGSGDREILLARGRQPADRDFVIDYRLASDRVAAGLLHHRDERGRFFTMLVQPPSMPAAAEVRARELVFVIDASCSMSGRPLDASKALIGEMLDGMRPEDRYKVIVFGSSARVLNADALAPTASNLARTKAELARLDTMGGTEIELGIKASLAHQKANGPMRIVVFLTDGYIGSEASVMGTIRRHRGDARIFAFGVGSSVNRWLIDEMAVAGRGVARVLGIDEDADEAAAAFAARVATPTVLDAWIDWGDAAVTDVTPAGTVDLYAGAPVRLMGRLPAGALPKPVLVGRVGGKSVRVPIRVAEAGAGAEAVPVLWARAQVAEKIRAMTSPATSPSERPLFVEAITKLGLDFGITTRWTAFVAVSEREVPPAKVTEAVAQAQPHGVSTFGGHSTPEPEQWAAFILLLALAGWKLRREQV